MNHLEFSQAATDEHLRGLMDSADLIASIIALGSRTVHDVDTMDRNVRHIEVMLDKPHIQESWVDLAPYRASITAGRNWLAAS